MAAARNPGKAAPMQAYMKTDQPFYGIQAVERRQIFKECAAEYPVGSREAYEDVIRTLWNGSHREDLYQALETAEHFKTFRTPESWPLYEFLVRTSSNWDTLDWIATKLIGGLIPQDRNLERHLKVWRFDSNVWVRRASLLAHLKHGAETNFELLGETIRLLARDREFFVRKAIGWVLREKAKTQPRWVIDFVRELDGQLSNLSRREALKNVSPKEDPDRDL